MEVIETGWSRRDFLILCIEVTTSAGKDTLAVCFAALLYEGSSRGMGTERSHAAWWRYRVCTIGWLVPSGYGTARVSPSALGSSRKDEEKVSIDITATSSYSIIPTSGSPLLTQRDGRPKGRS